MVVPDYSLGMIPLPAGPGERKILTDQKWSHPLKYYAVSGKVNFSRGSAAGREKEERRSGESHAKIRS
jgi:hypothetical protein